MTGDDLLQVLATLASPHRLRVVATLASRRNYVSQLAPELGISRALLQVHLRKLQAAGLVSADIEVSQDGRDRGVGLDGCPAAQRLAASQSAADSRPGLPGPRG